jgi:hypothetical protein
LGAIPLRQRMSNGDGWCAARPAFVVDCADEKRSTNSN